MRYLLYSFMLLMIASAIYFHLAPSHTPDKISLPPEETRTIYIVNHGWHAGIVLPADQIPKHLIPEKSFFPNMRYLEIGWGDSGFYQANTITFGMAMKALLRPTQSVVHVAAFNRSVENYFTKAQIVQLRISKNQFSKIAQFIHKSFDRSGEKLGKAFGVGRYGISYFFHGTGSYHIFRTCNRWVAEALSTGGAPIFTFYVATASSLMSQVRTLGKVIR